MCTHAIEPEKEVLSNREGATGCVHPLPLDGGVSTDSLLGRVSYQGRKDYSLRNLPNALILIDESSEPTV